MMAFPKTRSRACGLLLAALLFLLVSSVIGAKSKRNSKTETLTIEPSGQKSITKKLTIKNTKSLPAHDKNHSHSEKSESHPEVAGYVSGKNDSVKLGTHALTHSVGSHPAGSVNGKINSVKLDTHSPTHSVGSHLAEHHPPGHPDHVLSSDHQHITSPSAGAHDHSGSNKHALHIPSPPPPPGTHDHSHSLPISESGHHSEKHHTEPLKEVDTLHHHNLGVSLGYETSNNDIPVSVLEESQPIPELNQATPNLDDILSNSSERKNEDNDFMGEVAPPTDEQPLNQRSPDSAFDSDLITSDSATESVKEFNETPESVEPAVELSKDLQKALKIVKEASLDEQKAFAAHLPELFAELGKLSAELEKKKITLHNVKLDMKRYKENILESTFSQFTETEQVIETLTSETHALKEKVTVVTQKNAEKGAKTVAETNLLRAEIKEIAKEAISMRAESLTVLNTHVEENLKSLLHSKEGQHNFKASLNSINKMFILRESSVEGIIDNFVAAMSGLENAEDMHKTVSEAKESIKKAKQQNEQYILVEQKHDEIESKEVVINAAAEKLANYTKELVSTNETKINEIANVVKHLANKNENSSPVATRRKKRSLAYGKHLNDLTSVITEINAELKNLEKLNGEMKAISGVENIKDALNSHNNFVQEFVKENEWGLDHTKVISHGAEIADIVVNFLEKMKEFDHKGKRGNAAESLKHHRNQQEIELPKIMNQISEWNEMMQKNANDGVKMIDADPEKRLALKNALENMNNTRHKLNDAFEFYLKTHEMANTVHKKYEKLRNTTNQAEAAIKEAIEQAMKKVEAADVYDDQQLIHSEFFNAFDNSYNKLKYKLEKLDSKYVSLSENKSGLNEEHDKNLIGQLDEIEKEIKQVKADMEDHNKKLEGHKKDALVINDMLAVEKSVKEFENQTDKAEEEFSILYNNVEEHLKHEFSPEDIEKLDALENDFNKIKAKLEDMKRLFESHQFVTNAVHDQEGAKKVQQRIASRIDITISSMNTKQDERVRKIKEFRAYMFAYGHKGISDNEFATLKAKKEELEEHMKRKPENAKQIQKELNELNTKMESIKSESKNYHDGLDELSPIRNSLKDLEKRLDSVIAGSTSLLAEVDHIHLATIAEEEDRKIKKDLKNILKDGSEFRNLGIKIGNEIENVSNKVKEWAGFRPKENDFDFSQQINEDQVIQILKVDSYKSAHDVEAELEQIKNEFKKLEDQLEAFRTEKGMKSKGGEALETSKFKGMKPSDHINNAIQERQEIINKTIDELIKDMNDRIKTLEDEKKQSIEEIKAIEASVKLYKLNDSLKQPLQHLTDVIEPKLERSDLMANCNCDEHFMITELSEMNNTVTLSNQVKAEVEKEQLYEDAKKFNQLVQVLKENTKNIAGGLLENANKLIAVLEDFVKEMIKNINENIAKCKEIDDEFQRLELEKEEVIKTCDITRKMDDEAYRNTSKEEGEKENKEASMEADKEASKEANEKARRMGSEEDSKVESLKAILKKNMKSKIKERIKEEKKELRTSSQRQKLHKQLYELIKKLLAIRNKVISKENEFFNSPEREMFLKKAGITADKPKCQKYIKEIEIVRGQGTMLSDTIRKTLEPKHDITDNENDKKAEKPYIQIFIELGMQIYITPLELKMIQDGKVVENGDDKYKDNNNKIFKAAIEKLKESIKEKNKKLFETPKNELGNLIKKQESEKAANFRKMFEGANKAEQIENYKEHYIEYVENFERMLNEKKKSIDKTKNIVSKYLKAKDPQSIPFWPFTPADGDLVAKEPAEFKNKLEGIYNAYGNCLYKGYTELFALKDEELRSMKRPAMTAHLNAQKELLQMAKDKNIDISNSRDVFNNHFQYAVKSGITKQVEYIDKNSAN